MENIANLIKSLHADPAHFDGNQLLKLYQQGHSSETLHELILGEDGAVRRTGIWIAAELGCGGAAFLDDAIRVASDADSFVRYHALEIIALCANDNSRDKFWHTVLFLEDPVRFIRIQCMILMAKASLTQIEGAEQNIPRSVYSFSSHYRGLVQLSQESQGEISALAMVSAEDPLQRRYGGIAAWRNSALRNPLALALKSSSDEDLREFWSKLWRKK